MPEGLNDQSQMLLDATKDQFLPKFDKISADIREQKLVIRGIKERQVSQERHISELRSGLASVTAQAQATAMAVATGSGGGGGGGGSSDCSAISSGDRVQGSPQEPSRNYTGEEKKFHVLFANRKGAGSAWKHNSITRICSSCSIREKFSSQRAGRATCL